MKTLRSFFSNMREAWTEIRADRESMDLAISIITLPLWAVALWAWMWIASWMA